MMQQECNRLIVSRRAQKQKTQKVAGEEFGVSERQVRRLLRKLKTDGEKVAMHGWRGRVSNRKLSEKGTAEIIATLSLPVYAGFEPTMSREYLRDKHGIDVGRETLRKVVAEAKLCLVKGRG